MKRTDCRVIETTIEAECHGQEENIDPAHGAEVCFIGRVRNHNQGRSVESVSYDAFVPLAQMEFATICEEAFRKWGNDLNIQILHRIGNVNVGGASILIRVTSRHRDEAYLASRYILEEIKVRAPIWKKEHYINGETDWVRGHTLCTHAERHA